MRSDSLAKQGILLEEIENWLKNSVTGIVLLGAVGSIVAVPLLWAIRPLWNHFLRWLKIIHVVPVLRTNHELGFLDAYENKSMLMVFFAKHLTAFFLKFWVSLVALIILVARLSNLDKFAISIFDAILAAIGFLSFYQMVYTWWKFRATYDAHISRRITKKNESKTTP